MKQVVCNKMPVAYQNVDIGKNPGNVVYKVGPKVGLQQCGAGGTDGSAKCNMPNHQAADSAAAWNIIALSMYLRSKSPDTKGCLAPLSSQLNSASFRSSEGGRLSTSCASNLYSSFSGSLSGGQATEDHDRGTRLSNEDENVAFRPLKQADMQLSPVTESWSDEEKSCVSHCEDRGAAGFVDGGASLTRSWESSRLLEQQPYQPYRPHEGPELSSSSSSIGGCEDSSCSSSSREGSNGDSCSGDMEVESARRGGPLNQMNALEASLPIKRGLSKFWSGKAKSFANLASVSSIDELAKPEDPYAKRRRIISTLGDRHKSFPPLSRSSTSAISKRPTSTSGSRSSLAMAVAMGSKLEEAPKHSSASPSSVCSSRSLSLADLAQGGRRFAHSPTSGEG